MQPSSDLRAATLILAWCIFKITKKNTLYLYGIQNAINYCRLEIRKQPEIIYYVHVYEKKLYNV